MKSILVVMQEDSFCRQILADLEKDHEVIFCSDAASAAEQLSCQPDAMLLQLELPGEDGLTFLEHLPYRPAVILPIAMDFSAYTLQRIHELGAGYYLRTPCSLTAVTDRLRDMLRQRTYTVPDPQAVAAFHLRNLGIPSDFGGGWHLKVGIPLFAQDTHQTLSKELYPAIGQFCGASGSAVEYSIRDAIKKGWLYHDANWDVYFPESRKCPSNKAFISTLANKLQPDRSA